MLYQMNYEPEMTISLAKGNSKLGKGVFAFNLLPGDKPISTKDKGQLTNVPGTCGGCCDGCEKYCYAIQNTRQYHNTLKIDKFFYITVNNVSTNHRYHILNFVISSINNKQIYINKD